MPAGSTALPSAVCSQSCFNREAVTCTLPVPQYDSSMRNAKPSSIFRLLQRIAASCATGVTFFCFAIILHSAPSRAELALIDFKVSNPALFRIWGGREVGFLAGAEYRDESFVDDRDPRLDGTIVYTHYDGSTFPFVSAARHWSAVCIGSSFPLPAALMHPEFSLPCFWATLAPSLLSLLAPCHAKTMRAVFGPGSPSTPQAAPGDRAASA